MKMLTRCLAQWQGSGTEADPYRPNFPYAVDSITDVTGQPTVSQPDAQAQQLHRRDRVQPRGAGDHPRSDHPVERANPGGGPCQ